jgi:pimeloyl-ACP methyl ester carboxylesterase
VSFTYDPRHRPPQPKTPAPDAFAVHRSPTRDGVSLAYIREGAGGVPLLLVHGTPETKRIWWRNIGPLAAAGFEVIVPDLRGYGESDRPPDDNHDPVAYSRDLYALVHDHLGHEACIVAASDVGGFISVDLVHRFPGFVERFCVFNTVPPMGVDYAAAGIETLPTGDPDTDPTGDYRMWQGARPDELAAILSTPEARRLWVAGMYSSRLWGSPGAFSQADIDFMTEPFGDEGCLRSSWACYQFAYGRAMHEVPMMDAVDIPTLVLYGPDDHVLGENFVPACEIAFTKRIGPLVVPGAGHFLQWERADIFNAVLAATFGPRPAA